MHLGHDIRISILMENGVVKATVYFHNRMVKCIQSMDFTVGAGAFGEDLDRVLFKVWDPKETYTDEEQYIIQNAFIEEARRHGAEVEVMSVLGLPEPPQVTADPAEDDVEADGSAETKDSTTNLIHTAAGLATILGLAAIFSPKHKNNSVYGGKNKATSKKLEHSVSVKK